MANNLQIKIKLEGAEGLAKKMEMANLLGDPLKKLLWKAALLVQGKAQRYTPVDTGRLRAGFVSSIAKDPVPLWAKVGNPVNYAKELEESGKRPRRTGRIPFLAPAVANLRNRLNSMIGEAERLIRQRFDR